MELQYGPFDLRLAHRWTIASRLGPGGGGGAERFRVILVRLRDRNGVIGYGEAAPSSRYNENPETVLEFLGRVDASRLGFERLKESLEYLEALAPGAAAAKGAIDIALHDGAARMAGQPLNCFLSLPVREGRHLTSFSIGLDDPGVVRRKVEEAAQFPVLKLKLGRPDDELLLAALREVAPEKIIRVDGNEAWADKATALRKLEWLARDGKVEFVEQPMPAQTAEADLAWLKERAPIPIMADESYRNAGDLDHCARFFHAVNVKLVKAGGVRGGYMALQRARAAGLKTMLGCMIETSVLISAAAHLAELADYLDLDGNILASNDPFSGVQQQCGLFSFAGAPGSDGLQAAPRPGAALPF